MSGPFLVIVVRGIGIGVAFGGAWVSFLGWDGVIGLGWFFAGFAVGLQVGIGWLGHRWFNRLLSALCRYRSIEGNCKIIWKDVDW